MTHVVVTTEYGSNRILAIYGPFDERAAENLRMALPASSSRDHDVVKLSPPPSFDFSDKRGARGAQS